MHQDVPQLVGAAPQILDLLDQVEECEQEHERRENERRGGDDLSGDVPAQCSHRKNRNSEDTVNRR